MTKRNLSPKFATREMLVIIAFVALSCAAIASPSDAWVAILRLIVATSLLSAALGAVYRRGTTRAFWIGYTLFAFTCTVTAWLFPQHLATGGVVAAVSDEYGYNLSTSPSQLQSRLALEMRSLELKRSRFRASVLDPPERFERYMIIEKQLNAKEHEYRTARKDSLLVDVINSLYPLVAGFVGGSVASWFYRTHAKPDQTKDYRPRVAS